MRLSALIVLLIAATLPPVRAGELKKDYFSATAPGAWAEYRIEATDGTKSTSSSQRAADQDGCVVVEESVTVEAGPGAGAKVKNTFVFPKGFSLARDWLSYGKFTEKMTMKYGDVTMPVDAATLEAIKKSSKDYRGAVTFEAVEQVDGHACDRYAYAVSIAGPAPGKEVGQIWLDPAAPFGVVRQVAKTLNADGSVASSFETKLERTGAVQIDTPAAEPAVEKPAPVPSVVSLSDGYQAGRVGLDVTVEPGSSGRRMRVTLENKTEAELTVKLAAGALSLPAGDPVGALKIVVKQPASIVVPAGGRSEPFTVEQQAGRGELDGRFQISVYEGTPLFSGSVTRGTVGR